MDVPFGTTRQILLVAAAVIGTAGAPYCRAQSQKATQFEVAAISPANPSRPNMRFMFGPGGTFDGAGLTLRFLIEQAYGVRDSQISGGPNWIDIEKFDIRAKADGELFGPENFRAPLQKLLADRFQLKVHKGSKEMKAYQLVVAKNGPKFKESTDEASKIRRGQVANGTIEGPSITMAQLVEHLAHSLERVIADRTNLPGRYQIKLEWDPSGFQDEASPSAESSRASIFSALQSQLGLKLEVHKGPVDTIVVDQASKPSTN